MTIPADFYKKTYETLYTDDGDAVNPAEAYVSGGEHQNCMDYFHVYIHEGRVFEFSYIDQSFSDGKVLNLVFIPGATKNAHLTVAGFMNGEFLMEVFEGATVSADGTLGVSENLNREVAALASVTSATTIRIDPTITSAGASISQRLQDDKLAPAMLSRNNEKILKRGTKYLYRFTNVEGEMKTFSVLADYYEHSPAGTDVT